MKRTTTILFCMFFFLLSLSACGTTGQNQKIPQEVTNNSRITTSAPSSMPTKDIITIRAKEIVTALKEKNLEKLSQVVHPDKGVRVSPYAYVNTSTDRVITAAQIKNALNDNTKYTWGSYDGSGDPIDLTMEEYYNKFIYDVDFLNAPEVSYNKTLGKGNSTNNSKEVYPNANIVEYHFSGFDPQYSGMDWKSLRLVFEQKDTTWYLVGIIHDQWTI